MVKELLVNNVEISKTCSINTVDTTPNITFKKNNVIISEIISNNDNNVNTLELKLDTDNGKILLTAPTIEVNGILKTNDIIQSNSGDTSIILSGPDVKTARDLTTIGNATIGGNLVVDGNIDISKVITSSNTEISDILIKLGEGERRTPSHDLGFIFTRGDGSETNVANTGFIWDESEDHFALIECNTENGETVGNLSIDGWKDLKCNNMTLVGNITNATAGTAVNVFATTTAKTTLGGGAIDIGASGSATTIKDHSESSMTP